MDKFCNKHTEIMIAITENVTSIKEDVKKWGLTEGLEGKTVIVQGLGNVGYYAAKFMHEAGAKVIAIAAEGIDIPGAAHVIRIPSSPQMLQPVLATVPLQVFAYEMACARGTDVDQPRNLAKSVTVE